MQQASGDGDCTFNVRIACYATVLHSCNYTCVCDAYNAAERLDCSAHCCTTFQTQGHRSLRRRCNCGAHKMGYFRVLSLIETGYSTGMLIFITLRRSLAQNIAQLRSLAQGGMNFPVMQTFSLR